MRKSVLILEANSPIGRGIAAAYAKAGYQLFIADLDKSELSNTAQDLFIRHQVPVNFADFDVEQTPAHQKFFATAVKSFGQLDGIVVIVKADDEPSKISSLESLLKTASSYFSGRGEGSVVLCMIPPKQKRDPNKIDPFDHLVAEIRRQLKQTGATLTIAVVGETVENFGYDKQSHSRLRQTIRSWFAITPNQAGESLVDAVSRGKRLVSIPWYSQPIQEIAGWLSELSSKKSRPSV